MRALVLDEKNGPFRMEEREPPALEPGTVLLRVRACGVCHRDVIDRRGVFPYSTFPRVLGHEIAGDILEVGSGVTDFKVGDRVVTTHRPSCGECPSCKANEETRCERSLWSYGMTVDGGYTEVCLAHAGTLVKIPDAVDYAPASFLHCTAAVALRALFERGRLSFGETVLVTGASGGVGMHALQLVRYAGARVIAATTSPAKVELLKMAGAREVVVLGPGVRLQDEVRRLTGGRGAELALELVGSPTWNGTMKSVCPGGRIVLVGNVLAERVELNPGYAILNEIEIIGSAGAKRGDLESVLHLAAKGFLSPVLAGTLPLEQAGEAHERLKNRDVTGRLVLIP
jgi:D-arabinose 1-dehydrogenase-like Zn-dependent alcohol dehydrogenase